METIPKTDCEKIGFFRKTHGVHGEVVLEFEEHFEYSVEEAERFFVELDGLLVPFFIAEDGLRFKSSKSAIVKFDWVDTEKYAKRLIGASVYLFLDEIVDEPLESEALLKGFVLFDAEKGEVGEIEQVDDYSGNVVLTVKHGDEELLVPFHPEFVVEIDEEQKRLILNLPEGLIEG
ncbi:16S rRNA processing protein RimM [Maribellus luteus]|uniref:Ribosome maturation factor RimM n=1 Tax=Maribellus luteus TaxID=2305463 RepID=A0A399T0E0_9BACT|nr:16S rRNA processing protein RimM [Maribellus luteus]RIJ49786.1 16S rRNA processing protein RimM [Maribellus luteus]